MKSSSFIIIGGGIIGSAIARAIVIRRLGSVTVLEKELSLGLHASGRNSGVLHSGINQKPGSLKAQMCLEGSALAREYCRKHHVAMEECGTLVVSRTREEEEVLMKLLDMGKRVGVQGLRMLSARELHEREPSVVGEHALLSPHGAIVDSLGFLNAVADEAKLLGARYVMGAKVRGISEKKVFTSAGDFQADHIINCAGLYADTIARMMGVGLEYFIIPFRGEYFAIKNVKVNFMVYQAPNLQYPFLGVHLTKTVQGEVIAGPTAMLSLGRESYNKGVNVKETFDMLIHPQFWKLVTKKDFLKLAWHNTKMFLSRSAFLKEIKTLLPAAMARDMRPFRAGIRAQVINKNGEMVDDILVEFRNDSTHILNAVSPGMTCSLAFAPYVVDRIR